MVEEHQRALTREEIEHIIGRVEDRVAVRIIASGANAEQVMAAFEWLSAAKTPGEEDDRPLSGVVGEVYDILTAGAKYPDEDEQRR